MASSSSSSVVPTRRKGGWTYDVFLSFRGEDVRNNFVDHLYDALVRNGIRTFKDDKMLGGGQPISQELVKAIKESRFAVVVFSKNYAESSWCLDELSKIMECQNQMGGQIKVLPVFYHVDPSDVRGQKRDFATAFETHEDRFKGEMDRVNKWREALTAAANLSGQHILPDYGYMDVTNRAISYTRGLPLALKVLGSFLCGREASVWGSALDTLAKTPSGEVFDTLKLSYDYLNDLEKKIFLDIVCFYKGQRVDEVTRILDSFGFEPVIGINVLVEKSLITISSDNTLDMHDLVEEMGRKVVQASALNSRLWEPEKIHDLINKKELEVIEGIVLPWEESKESLRADSDVFKSMRNLRVLECDGKFTSCEPAFLPDGLRWLCWREYPFSFLPVALMSKLVGLEMWSGRIEHLWKVGEKIMLQNLKFIHLRMCESLKRFPDVSGAPNIESLNLGFCKNMVEVDESVGSLKKLVKLDMTYCFKLKCVPSMLQMETLETLFLYFCTSLERIPEFSPSSIITKLDISYCSKVEELPSSIKYLSNLSYLKLNGCRSLGKLPDYFQSMESLEELCIDSIYIHAFTNFCYLRKLYLYGDLRDSDFPKNLNGLSSLEELHIYDNWKLIQIPESISHLSTLKHLLIRCSRLQTLHGLPPGIQVLTVTECKLLEKIEDLSKEYKCLNKIRFSHCPKLLEDKKNERYLEKMLDQSFLKNWVAVDSCLTIQIPGSNIPSWFKEQQDGGKIALKLPLKWQTQVIGLAICFVSMKRISYPKISINLRFENDEMLVSKSEANNINETVQDGYREMWTGYIPYSLFEQFRGGNDSDFEGEDWFHMTEDNLVITSHDLSHVVRCGAKVVYKEEVASIQQTIPSISSFYWNWKLTKDEFTNSLIVE